MKQYFHFEVLVLLLACYCMPGAGTASAQTPISNLVVTAGTTIQDSSGNNWSYVLLGAPDYQLLAGKKFAIYGKTGYPTNAGSFSLRGTIFQQTTTNAINTLLNQSVSLGENLTALSASLVALLHSNPVVANVSLPQQVLIGFQSSVTSSDIGQTISLLAHTHPGLILCLGQGFAEIITNTTTYEVREVSPATGLASEVIGRVTIQPGNPVILPAPSAPFQVTTNDQTDHLRIRLRWGTSDAFRRLSLLSFGFNVWRIPLAAAIAEGYTNNPPSVTQLHNDPNITNVNSAPVIATKDFSTNSGPGGANDPTDGTTYFFSDKKGFTGITSVITNANGVVLMPSSPPFNDGDQFYYFITARDVLGRDGLVSPGGLAEACRRMPLQQPTNVAVQNVFQVINNATLSNTQFLEVTWQQDSNVADQATEYWVYRWANPAMALTNDVAPTNSRIAVVLQSTNSTNFYEDTGPGAPLVPGLSNYWYTVRAVSQAACGPVLSPHSMPVWGVLRQRVGPTAANGQILGSCGSPVVMFQNLIYVTNTVLYDTTNWDYILACQRTDPGTAWVEFFVTNQFGQGQMFGPIYFASGSDLVQVDYSPSISGTNDIATVTCVAGTTYGLVSPPATVILSNAPISQVQLETLFLAGEVMLTSLTSTNPLLPAIGGAGPCFPAIGAKAYPNGTVRMQFDYAGSSPLLIQAGTNGIWTDIAVATRDPNGYYSVYFPACLLGPLPSFQGCAINLPAEGDCPQSITRGANNSPVNPVQITFTLTPGTAEFRLYRSVNNGPLTMIAQAAATYDPFDTNATVTRTDDGMPPSAALLCYYVQLYDVHGNGSPMSFLGCKEVKPAQLPIPVESEPQVMGNNSNPLVGLTWFCPTSGVYRYEVLVERADHPGGGVPLGFSSASLTTLASFNNGASWLGLLQDLAAAVQFDAAFLTPPSGASFGPGPQFTLTASVLTNVPYNISIAAVDDQGNFGLPSKVWSFTWKPTNSSPSFPWPARPLPPVDNAFDDTAPPSPSVQPRVAAVLLNDIYFVLDPNYPVGVRIGDLSPIGFPPDNINTTNFFTYQIAKPDEDRFSLLSPQIDPNTMIFRRVSNNHQRSGNLLLPIVLYRQQVTNAAFPRVSGTVTQVSPLIEHLAYGTMLVSNSYYNVTIYDRLIAGGSEGRNGGFLYVRDQQPVIQGASYQYFVARMSDQREIAEIIPAGTVTIPPPP